MGMREDRTGSCDVVDPIAIGCDLHHLIEQPWTVYETGTYDAQDRMLTYAGASYTYTANGETLTKTDATGTTSYQYDVFGNLLGVDLPNGTQIRYKVDGRNRRIERRVNGGVTQRWLWQGQLSPIAELNASNAVVSRFVYATRVNVPDYMVKGGATYRILHDHLGSPRLVVNTSTGAIAQRMDFDEWGIVTTDTNPGWQPFGFAGGMYEKETSLGRNGLRDLHSAIGRWTSRDAILFSSGESSLVAYGSNDPVNAQDPLGLAACISRYPGGGGFGHVGIGVNSSETVGLYPVERTADLLFGPVPGVVKPDNSYEPESTVCLQTTNEQDEALKRFLENAQRTPPAYDLLPGNCVNFVEDALRNIGIDFDVPNLPDLLMVQVWNLAREGNP